MAPSSTASGAGTALQRVKSQGRRAPGWAITNGTLAIKNAAWIFLPYLQLLELFMG